MKGIFAVFLSFIASINIVFATPQEIVIIRHGDKLPQSHPGPALSAQGEVRAINFAFYFLQKFGEPDFIITSDADSPKGKFLSIRELESVGPLANILQERHSNVDIPILHPFTNSHYDKLAKYVLTEKKFNDKLILICISHGKIPLLAKELGVKNIPAWLSTTYDSVLVIRYNNNGDIADFKIFNEQYPVNFSGSWKELYTLINRA